jgi:NAD+ diphosphatase
MADFFSGVPQREPSQGLGFAVNPIERRSEEREETALATALGDPSARFYLFHAGDALTRGTEALFTLAEAEALHADLGAAVLLGWLGPAPRLAAPVDAPPPDGIAATSLRTIATEGALAAADIGGLAQAQGLLNWHGRHRFCSNCGAPTRMARGGYRRDCPSCSGEHFPRTDPVVIMLTVDGDNALLGRQPRFPAGFYSCLAGFLEPGETIEDAVRRETYEESHIRVGRVRYWASQPWPFPTSLMIGCHAEALDRDIERDAAELEDCRWFPRAEVLTMLARTHPAGLATPPAMAIAHQLIAAWAG